MSRNHARDDTRHGAGSCGRYRQLTVLAIYTEGNPEAWENDLSSIPSGWLAGTDREAIKLGALYDLKAMPSLYLLDGEKRVLLKDAPYSRIRAELGL